MMVSYGVQCTGQWGYTFCGQRLTCGFPKQVKNMSQSIITVCILKQLHLATKMLLVFTGILFHSFRKVYGDQEKPFGHVFARKMIAITFIVVVLVAFIHCLKWLYKSLFDENLYSSCRKWSQGSCE